MQARIDIKRRAQDEELFELELEVCDGASSFHTSIWSPRTMFADVIKTLRGFGSGICDLRFGLRGFHATLYAQRLGVIYMKVHVHSESFSFGPMQATSEATLYLVTEPNQLDDFVRALEAIAHGYTDHATLMARAPWPG